MNKDQIKRELSGLLPEDTSSDLITRLATYVEGKMNSTLVSKCCKAEMLESGQCVACGANGRE